MVANQYYGNIIATPIYHLYRSLGPQQEPRYCMHTPGISCPAERSIAVHNHHYSVYKEMRMTAAELDQTSQCP